MFSRFARNLKTLLPLSLAFLSHQYSTPLLSLDSQPETKPLQSHRIKVITDIGQYIDKENDLSRAVLICELHDDQFVDAQLIKIAEDFVKAAEGNVSADFDFVFVKGEKLMGEEIQNYLIIYSNKGEKVINLESYINRNKEKPNIKVSNSQLMRRLIEAINGQRQLSLLNLSEELAVIQNTANYSALVVVPDEKDTNKTEEELSSYLKHHQVKSKTCSRYIVRDEHSRKILGLNGKTPGIYLLSPVNNNLLPDFKEKTIDFKIGQKPYCVIPADQNLGQIFAIPPIQPVLPPDQIVLNVYINKNMNTADLERTIVKELAKPEYKQYQKGLYYTNEVEEASITLEMNDYSKVALTAFDPEKPIEASRVKQILQNTYEWNFPLKSSQPIDSTSLQKWISECTGDRKMELQVYKSKRGGEGWSTVLTGREYKSKISEPNDKVIYHYSSHCHGCKKFGGKFEQFARNRHRYPGLSFYRVNNDKNKAEGVRNFNSTPVFAYYKQNCLNPFVYRMPIFTEELFEAFIKITGGISLMDPKLLSQAVQKKSEADVLIKELATGNML